MNKAFLVFFVFSSLIFSQNFGTWTLTDSLKLVRGSPLSVTLDNGNVLLTGGWSRMSLVNETEIFNYKSEKWEIVGSMTATREDAVLTKLNDGKVLALGGSYDKSSELFNPKTNTWSLTNSLSFERSYGETATLLNNGDVIVVGGYYNKPGNTKHYNSCEIYKPNPGKWENADTLKYKRTGHKATKLLDGKILVTGGHNSPPGLNSCEIFNPMTGKWVEAASMNIPRYTHSATLLLNGNVLIMGGKNSFDPLSPWLNSCEIYNPVSNTWTIVSPLIVPRFKHMSVLLKNVFY